jgi:hypothetical protein
VANGDATVWDDLKELRRDLSNLARDGCGHKLWHEGTTRELRADFNAERKERVEMGKELADAIGRVGEASVKEMKSIRNQIMGSLVLVVLVAVLVSKVLK